MAIGVALLGPTDPIPHDYSSAFESYHSIDLKVRLQARDIFIQLLRGQKSTSSKTSSLDEVLARKDIQAVVIDVPPKYQPRLVKICLDADKHVLCLNPFANETSEAQSLVDYYNSIISTPRPKWATACSSCFYNPVKFGAEKLAAIGGSVQSFFVKQAVFIDAVHVYGSTNGSNVNPISQSDSPSSQQILSSGVNLVSAFRHLLSYLATDVSSVQARPDPINGRVDQGNNHLHAKITLTNGACGTLDISFRHRSISQDTNGDMQNEDDSSSIASTPTLTSASTASTLSVPATPTSNTNAISSRPSFEIQLITDKGFVSVSATKIHFAPTPDPSHQEELSPPQDPAAEWRDIVSTFAKNLENTGIKRELANGKTTKRVKNGFPKPPLSHGLDPRLDPERALGDQKIWNALKKSAETGGKELELL